ncbi:MAG: glycosyltransferase family 61 protein [Bacteroidia bacterium]|nr:glycosyltransferase family 61 protein [Bacteroidia bacterium]MDW8134272.1 glycosyltransferase family 61 protein [Bacteroidia bacterium]
MIEQRLERGVLPILYVRNATVLPVGIVLKGWRLLRESCFWDRPHLVSYWQRYGIYKKLTLRRSAEDIEEGLLIHHPWSNNYTHWFADCLPRLLSVERYTELPILLPEEYQPFTRESLRALGVKKLIPLKRNLLYSVRRLVLPHMPALDSLANSYAQLQYFRQVFLSQWGGTPQGKRIYLSREKATRRKVVNEGEILPILEKYGFMVIRAEEFSFAEQVRIFSQANVLLALHGSGHMNLLWMPSGSKIIEVLSESHVRRTPPQFLYANFSRLLAHEHYYFLAPTAPHSLRDIFDTADVILEPDKLDAFLGSIL